MEKKNFVYKFKILQIVIQFIKIKKTKEPRFIYEIPFLKNGKTTNSKRIINVCNKIILLIRVSGMGWLMVSKLFVSPRTCVDLFTCE